jgi:hypothetical protein
MFLLYIKEKAMGFSVFPASSSGGAATVPQPQTTTQVTTSTNNISIPANVNQVYAICIGGGAGGSASGAGGSVSGGIGGGGGIVFGYCPPSSVASVGAAGNGGADGYQYSNYSNYYGDTSYFYVNPTLGNGGGSTSYSMITAPGGEGTGANGVGRAFRNAFNITGVNTGFGTGGNHPKGSGNSGSVILMY